MGMRRGVSPHHPTRRLFTPPVGSGAAENGFYAYLRKKPPGTPFSVFLSDGVTPNVAVPVETPPLSTGL